MMTSCATWLLGLLLAAAGASAAGASAAGASAAGASAAGASAAGASAAGAGGSIQHFVTDVNFVEGDYLNARCEPAEAGAAARFPARRMRFRRVSFYGCALPGVSYAATLLALNVTVTEVLALYQIPSDARILATSFVGLPASLDSLELKAAAGALVPEEGFLDPLSELRSLWLDRVRPARLPPRLDVLRLINTGIEFLPPEAFSVIVLEVSEPELRSITGSESLRPRECARLRELTLARVRRLPAALAAACPALSSLTLSDLHAPALPPRLLHGADHLVSFHASQSRFASLPPDLFAYSPRLRHITLNNLGLENLPSELFSGLDSLEQLTLAHNRLRARDVPALARVTSLRSLDLTGNPIGDLCSASRGSEVSVLAGLRRLQQLQLRSTGTTRVCTSWLRDVRSLRGLDLTGNAITALHCGDLLAERAQGIAFLDLSTNPLVRVYCDKADYDRAAAHPTLQMANLVVDSRLECDCGAYWLARVLRDHHLPAQFEAPCVLSDDAEITKSLEDKCTSEDGGTVALGVVLSLVAIGALGALALVAVVSRPGVRLRLKALLHARRDPPDADRPFDAFVAHAEADDRFVAEHLAPRLEPARRLCLAYRNWPGGAWIPAQIDESVRRSRRTLCLVSRHFLDSHMARAELRAAHAHALHDSTPRLLLLLLDVSVAELDDELRAALVTHTHLRWGEPCFWEKLAYELPEPRPAHRPESKPAVAA